MRSKVLGVLKAISLSLLVVTCAGLLALTIMGPELRVQAKEKISKFPGIADEPHVVAYNTHNLIRFHVVANSDSDRDQALKRRVRDLVVQRMAPEFSKAKNLNDARIIAKSHLGEIKEIAMKEIKLWGKDYPVSVMLGRFDFPVKTYGKLTLPAGNYEAVRVVIGKGQGANWWCVLFPPLCFVDVSKGMTPGSSENVGKAVDENAPKIDTEKVSEAVYETPSPSFPEYASSSVQDDEPEEQKVVIRFKILELFGW